MACLGFIPSYIAFHRPLLLCFSTPSLFGVSLGPSFTPEELSLRRPGEGRGREGKGGGKCKGGCGGGDNGGSIRVLGLFAAVVNLKETFAPFPVMWVLVPISCGFRFFGSPFLGEENIESVYNCIDKEE